jgi:hypothetical protein
MRSRHVPQLAAIQRKDASAESVVRFARDEIQLQAPESLWSGVWIEGQARNVARVYYRRGKYDYRLSVERHAALPDDPIGHAWGES